MSDSLLPYYNRELVAIRKLAAEFAEANPKIAGRLRLAVDAVDDPHVARLLDGTAFLAARVHHRLDDEFPELTDALLGLLYPQFLAPVPASAIAQLTCAPEMSGPLNVPAGLAVDSEPVRGEPCRFRTSSPVTLWPIEIEAARLSGLPLAAPANTLAQGALSVLRVTLRCVNPDSTFSTLGLDKLRLFLRAPANVSLPLYELLCGHTLSVAYADGPLDASAVLLGGDALKQAGFDPEDRLFPWPARGFSGFRLLAEYFAMPEKFLFIDLDRIDTKTLANAGRRMDVFIYLDRAVPELERSLNAETFALGCVPIVNLFPQSCEPIPVTHEDTEYRVVPDSRRPGGMEVWSIERVRETGAEAVARPWRPFYRLSEQTRQGQAEGAGGFYHTIRRPSPSPLRGSDVFLAPFDPGFDANQGNTGTVLSIDALCTNRDLPAELPFGGGHPRMKLSEAMASISRVICITAPTAPLRLKPRDQTFWRLISHLSIGHLSLVGGADGAAAMKEALRLYDWRDTAETRAAIEGLVGVSSRPGAARVPGSRAGAFCRGLDVTLEFEQRAWDVGGLYLLASVLDRFLALHATVNSFVRTSAVLRGRAGRVAAFPARAGARVLL
jgi:type VI secretion system protein ImpG